MRILLRPLAFLLLCHAPIAVPAQSLVPAPEAPAAEPAPRYPGPACDVSPDIGTSSDYLVEVARCLHGESDALRVALVEDIHIKSWSYAILNKGAFWLALALAALVLIWPSIVAIASAGPRKGKEGEDEPGKAVTPMIELDPTRPGRLRLLRSTTVASALQTSIAALAALSFAFYAHYKGNQVTAETLMREIIFSETLEDDRVLAILAAISDMDKGFSFAKTDALSGGG